MALVAVELASIVMIMTVILLPRPTQTSHCMETGMQFLLQRQPTILCESERSLNDSPFRRG